MESKKNLLAVNPWHAVSAGSKSPAIVNAIIEIKKGSKVKYELDKESGLLKMDRVLFSSVHYPSNYGFIPQTYFQDNDPLDILVLCSEPLQPMCLIEARVIGVMKMIDQDQWDDKIIAVANKDMSMADYHEIEQLPKHILDEIQNFFSYYKVLQKKTVKVETFESRQKACEIVLRSMNLYQQKFGK